MLVDTSSSGILNSILAVLFIITFIGTFWIINKLDITNIVLLKFYFNEFLFNLTIIFEDIAKIIFKIIN